MSDTGGDKNFETLLEKLKKLWYYIMKVDDWDRYLYEVYVRDEVVCITWNENEAYMKLWEFVQNDLSE